ncbi:vp1054 [Hyphantria cunea granulovirus]|uniref:Vp1054 n=1 Tax=Hyphantria cunea granulovirus TaxID=307448 RepID=A0AAF1D2C1_9BBAC|nr:vp1054 [Hyphantria cunea granulovirus]QBQ01679.1 vp1054 [Hyphantria cunea granulovirus]
MLEGKYLSPQLKPYYEWLLMDNLIEESGVERQILVNQLNRPSTWCTTIVCGVKFEAPEMLYSIAEAGEKEMEILKRVFKTAYAYLNNFKTKIYVLLNNLYVDCLYSTLQCVILPQELYCLYKDGEEPYINKVLSFTVFPECNNGTVSQDIYKSFIVYNTVLTLMLKEANPFNDKTKTISKIFESVGSCDGGSGDGKKTRVKVCGLKFGGTCPDHIMCPPKEMVSRIFHYAKWVQNPNNYKRYIELIVDERKKNTDKIVQEWYVFQMNFKNYFFPE